MNKYSSQGCLLQVEIATVFTTVGQTLSIDFPDGEVQFFDATDLESDHVEDGELTGLSTPGSSGAELFYDPADTVHELLASDHAAKGVHRDWKIVMPDTGANVVTYEGSVSRFQPKAAAKDGFKANLSIKLRNLAAYPS